MSLVISFKNLVTWELIKNIFPYAHKNNKNKDKKHQQQWQQTLLERERKFVSWRTKKTRKNPPEKLIKAGWMLTEGKKKSIQRVRIIHNKVFFTKSQ